MTDDYPAHMWIDFSADRHRPVLRDTLDWPWRRDAAAIAAREQRLAELEARPLALPTRVGLRRVW